LPAPQPSPHKRRCCLSYARQGVEAEPVRLLADLGVCAEEHQGPRPSRNVRDEWGSSCQGPRLTRWVLSSCSAVSQAAARGRPAVRARARRVAVASPLSMHACVCVAVAYCHLASAAMPAAPLTGYSPPSPSQGSSLRRQVGLYSSCRVRRGRYRSHRPAQARHASRSRGRPGRGGRAPEIRSPCTPRSGQTAASRLR